MKCTRYSLNSSSCHHMSHLPWSMSNLTCKSCCRNIQTRIRRLLSNNNRSRMHHRLGWTCKMIDSSCCSRSWRHTPSWLSSSMSQCKNRLSRLCSWRYRCWRHSGLSCTRMRQSMNNHQRRLLWRRRLSMWMNRLSCCNVMKHTQHQLNNSNC